ncbi:MAG: tRNA (adenosine(37)-N6)-threonylcarbamoyltransferase complex transferase subunit TsaD, partial [Holosporaceae bacterium]|nr:tRNA (adenosine(37)-N6)-threonylcarbamoyltransferase complex transferase subunit TsaD [Holosporaceae bacterium]
TIDDSVGESFDKVSKLLGFGYPGGPIVEEKSTHGNSQRFALPRPLCNKYSYDFSFSGLKTAARIIFEKYKTPQDKIDLCASFQGAVVDVLVYKMKQAIEICREKSIKITAAVIAGGVAANKMIRTEVKNVCDQYELPFWAPPIYLCTDNGAMIAWLGIEKLMINQENNIKFSPRPQWPLGE